ncbi:hypothetical protein [Kingella potus]|uniref:hypothetical protein n=1 Tax=Kingella potus TaxID=265175 RepID=UPI001FD4536D|nr:hypothetical protein [Kingella potus]UOP01976.1 hypothetical protein LVJ84_06850 [Kingella potus]
MQRTPQPVGEELQYDDDGDKDFGMVHIGSREEVFRRPLYALRPSEKVSDGLPL